MGKLRLIELIDNKLESKIHLRGFKNFYDGFLNNERGFIQYYSFNPPTNFLIKIGLGGEILPEDIYTSKIFSIYSKNARTFMQKRFPQIASGQKDFIKKEKILMDTYMREMENFEEEDENQRVIKANSALEKVPFFSKSWKEYMELEDYFLNSKFEIEYFGGLRNEIETYKKKFTPEEFHWKEYNQYIFERVYELFSKEPLFRK